jgi:agmatine deiminase
MNYERMSANLKILEQSTDQDGKPFTIVKVPLPDLITQKAIARRKIDSKVFTFDVDPADFIPSEAPAAGDSIFAVPASSYMNYLVTNGLVLLPTYTLHGSSKEKEENVRKIFERYFPGRKIAFFNAIKQNWSGGGIHCSTQQQPGRIQ